MNSQKGYLFNAVQLERKGPDLNMDLFIQEIFLTYLYYTV